MYRKGRNSWVDQPGKGEERPPSWKVSSRCRTNGGVCRWRSMRCLSGICTIDRSLWPLKNVSESCLWVRVERVPMAWRTDHFEGVHGGGSKCTCITNIEGTVVLEPAARQPNLHEITVEPMRRFEAFSPSKAYLNMRQEYRKVSKRGLELSSYFHLASYI